MFRSLSPREALSRWVLMSTCSVRGYNELEDECLPTERESRQGPARSPLPTKDHPYHSHEKKDDEPHEYKLGHAHLARLPECFSDQPCHGSDRSSDGARIHKSR